jgi:hypothetical protein
LPSSGEPGALCRLLKYAECEDGAAARLLLSPTPGAARNAARLVGAYPPDAAILSYIFSYVQTSLNLTIKPE